MIHSVIYKTAGVILTVLLLIVGGCGEDKKSDQLSISPQNHTMNVGDSLQFSVSKGGTDVTSSVSWVMSNTGIISMSSTGLAVALREGTTKITATYNNESVWTNITVQSQGGGAATLQSITIGPDTASIAVSGTQQFTATGHYSDSSTQNLTSVATWASDNNGVATISSTGLAAGVSAGTSYITASYSGKTSNSATLTVTTSGGGGGGGGGSGSNTISTNINAASVVSLGTTTNTSIAASALGGYIDFPTTDGKGYGIYVTADSASLSLDAGYNNGGNWVSIGVGSVNPSSTSDYLLGFKAGAADYMAKISNSANSAVTFAFTVREADMGGSPFGTPLSVSPGTPAWIGAAWLAGDFSFVAGGSTATLQLDSLTAGVDVAVYEADKTTVVLPKTTDGTEMQLTKTVNLAGLTHGNTYVVRVSSLVGGTSGASIGRLTITSSGGAYDLSSLSGAWLLDTTADRSAGYDFIITDGSGSITSSSLYSASTPTYSVQSNGAFTIYTPSSDGTTLIISGTLASSTTGTLSGVGPNSTISKISDRALCQGAWTGALLVSSSPVHDLAFEIKADGTLDTAQTRTITPSGGGAAGTISSGAMVGQGNLCVGYFTTSAAEPYNKFRINGTLTTGATTTLSGNFDNDSGSAWPVGTVSLTK